MMIIFHRNFEKRYKRLSNELKNKFKERQRILVVNPNDPILNNHPLHGKYSGYKSINISGDLRTIYKKLDSETILFIEIGTHSDLYE